MGRSAVPSAWTLRLFLSVGSASRDIFPCDIAYSMKKKKLKMVREVFQIPLAVVKAAL